MRVTVLLTEGFRLLPVFVIILVPSSKIFSTGDCVQASLKGKEAFQNRLDFRFLKTVNGPQSFKLAFKGGKLHGEGFCFNWENNSKYSIATKSSKVTQHFNKGWNNFTIFVKELKLILTDLTNGLTHKSSISHADRETCYEFQLLSNEDFDFELQHQDETSKCELTRGGFDQTTITPTTTKPTTTTTKLTITATTTKPTTTATTTKPSSTTATTTTTTTTTTSPTTTIAKAIAATTQAKPNISNFAEQTTPLPLGEINEDQTHVSESYTDIQDAVAAPVGHTGNACECSSDTFTLLAFLLFILILA